MAVWNVINHTELSSTTSIYAVSSIPVDGTYDHLYLMASVRSTTPGVGTTNATFRVGNGSVDSTGHYDGSRLYAYTSTPACAIDINADGMTAITIEKDGQLADTYGTVRLWVPNYANTTGYKKMFSQSVAPNNSSTDSQWMVRWNTTVWPNTAAITDIQFHGGGYHMEQYSSFTLYGITGL